MPKPTREVAAPPLVAYSRGTSEAKLTEREGLSLRIDRSNITPKEARWWSNALAELACAAEEHSAGVLEEYGR